MIDIKDIKGNTIYSTEINSGSTRKFELMQSDCIVLKFSLETPLNFPIGCYVDEISLGLFERIDNAYKPRYNTSTGGYDYELQLDAYYRKWKNKIFKFTPEVGGQEASWSLTASLDVHLSIFLKNLQALGYKYRGIDFEFSIDSTVENKAIGMTYDNTNMLDALSSMAERWECEWWVTDNIIYFGRCEYGTPVDFILNENVAEMSRSESKSVYATRIYAFGSTRNIPSNYRPVDGDVTVNGIVQKRLMLPEGKPYVDAYENMSEEEAIEQVVVFDDVYPRTQGSIDSVTTYEDTVENEDGTTTTETFYRFTDSGIKFSKDYILEGEELRIKFERGLLNGMDFGVAFNPNGEPEKLEDGSWNPAAQLFEIVVNDDYGRPLPDEVLKPKEGDTYVLYGWDSTKIADLGLIDEAEKELLEKANEYVKKSMIDPNTYNCKMMSDYMYGLDNEGNQNPDYAKVFEVGDRVNLINKGFFEEGRQSRIIGYEYNLDFPYDNPTYTVGETASYSRIGDIEDKIDAITFGGQVYTGGGGSGVYIIGTNDTTKPTNRNVYSALKSDQSFLRKDKDDSTSHVLGVGGLSIKGKQITQFTRYYDEDKPEYATDNAIYSALMVEKLLDKSFDDKYLRKDKEDTAHKHITFEEGITVYDLAKMVKLEVDELATIARAVVESIGSANFIPDFVGEGFRIWKEIATGDWSMHLDTLTVRKFMRIYELIIQKIRSAGGMIVVSAANGKVKEVVREGIEYKFTFEDANTFAVNDLMRCQVFSDGGQKYYWVEITRVEGENVFARVADFNGQIPEKGDECVLMGNTKNVLRQNMIIISATDDGRPMFSCYNGIDSKVGNFEGHLRTRIGSLDGIQDDRFPSDMQPQGYGLYADNCYLTGVFVLSNGNEVSTQFSIMEGMIRSEISSVRAEINAQDNYLANASFSSNLSSWEYDNNVRVFNTSGGLLHFNGNFYAIKENFAGVVVKDSKNVLRIKNSFIMQRNADYNIHPSFDLYKDEETGEELYRPRMFYVSFKYLCVEGGTMNVYFKDETDDGTFEPYTSIHVEKTIVPNVSFTVEEFEGKWNGTGDFYLSFDGDIYIYDLALADNALADVEEKFTTRFEQTDKKIQANLEYTNGKLEEYNSEFKLTAQSLESTFNTKLTNQYNTITSEYTGKITQTSKELRSEYTELVEDTESDITSKYNSLVSQTAREIKAELTELVEDTESELIEDYEAQISATARSLTSDYEAQIYDLKNGEIKTMQATITQQANLIATKVSQTDFNALTGRMSEAETTISENSEAIELRATKTEFNELGKRVSTAESNITTAAGNISALSQKLTFDSSGNLTNISKSGLVLDSEFASMFTTQVNSQGIAKTAQLSAYVLETELGDLVSKIEISADQIDLTGKVTFSDLSSGAKTSIKQYSTDATDALAEEMGLDTLNSRTIISGGFIKTSLIDADAIVTKKLYAENGSYSYSLDANGFNIKDGSTTLASMYVSSSQSSLHMSKGTTEMWLTPSSIGFTYGSSAIDVTASRITMTNAQISGFAVTTASSSTVGTSGFIRTSANVALPSASTNAGRIVFIRTNGERNITSSSSNIYPRGDNNLTSSLTRNNSSQFFISDGSYWYEFFCG